MRTRGKSIWLWAVAAALVVPNVAMAAVDGYDYLQEVGGSAVAANGKWEDPNNWQELQGGDPARWIQRSDSSWKSSYWLGHSVPSTEDTEQPVFIRNGSTVTYDALSGTNIVRSVAIGGWEYSPGGTGVNPWKNAGGHFVFNGGTLKIGRDTTKELKVGNWYDGTMVQNGGYVEAYSMFIGDRASLYVSDDDPNGTFHSSVGVYTLNSGTLDITGQYVRLGYRGGEGTVTIGNGAYVRVHGTLDPNGAHVDLGLGMVHNFNTGGTVLSRGVLNVNGGTLEMHAGDTYSRHLGIGAASGSSSYEGAIGVLNMTGGLITLGGTASDIQAGRKGRIDSLTSVPDPNWRAQGTMNMSGGSVACRDLKFGAVNGSAVLNMSGGTISLTGGGIFGEATVERGLSHGGNTADGTINMSGGVIGQQAGTGTMLYIGRGSYLPAEPPLSPNESVATGTGVFNLSGGSAHFDSITLGYGDNSQSVGKLNASGGTLTTDAAFAMAGGDKTSAFVTITKDATISVGSLSMYDSATTERTSRLAVDIGKDGVGGKIAAAGTALLDGTLRLNLINRPKEGDVLNVVTSGGGITDSGIVLDYDTLTGLKGTLPAFAGAVDGSGNIYQVTFQALTEGDCNGDGKVDGGDLALMGGAWMLSGQGWGTGNFNNDPNGLVDGGDLALMGGMWMWVKPSPAPEQTVPEPAALSLLAVAGLAIVRKKRATA